MVIEKANKAWAHDGPVPLDRAELLRVNEEMASRGLRVLCIALKRWEELPDCCDPETVEQDLVILGLVGMMDPPRDEAKDAVALCKAAGIIPVMITGDHPITASAVARRIGILDENDSNNVISGRELEDLSLEEFEKG